jgi:hypothetical protein
MRRLACSLALLLACGDDEGPGLDAGAPDASADGGPDAGTPACEVGATVSGSIGAAGGELALCGALLRVAPGELDAPVDFAIEWITPPTPPDEPRVLAGPAFRFTPDDQVLPGLVEVHVPHDGEPGRLEMVGIGTGGETSGFEACGSDEETVWQFFGSVNGTALSPLGKFVAVRDTYAYADSNQDLGSGTVSATLGERELVFVVGSDGFAIDEYYPAGVSLTAQVEVPDQEDLEQLRVQLFVPPGGETQVIYIQWYSEMTIWSFGFGGSATADVALVGDRVVGTLSGELVSGKATLPFAIELDVLAEYWRFPPERVCPGGR